MKLKVITSYKPGTWKEFAKRGIDSMAEQFPKEVDIVMYCEEPVPQDVNPRIKCIDLNTAEPALFNFKNKHKNDPVANGKLQEIPGGVRRSPELQTLGGQDKNKESFLWDAVRFANKVFCIVNAVRNSAEYDYVLWLDADTFTFRAVPLTFFSNILLPNTMLTYLGRERDNKAIYPECGFVGYNLKHPEIQNFINDWEQLYVTDDVFKILEWHDSAVFWELSKKYQKEKNITINDIGYAAGVKGHHVFVNSILGSYIDHFKGNRKETGRSSIKDLIVKDNIEDYWRQAK